MVNGIILEIIGDDMKPLYELMEIVMKVQTIQLLHLP